MRLKQASYKANKLEGKQIKIDDLIIDFKTYEVMSTGAIIKSSKLRPKSRKSAFAWVAYTSKGIFALAGFSLQGNTVKTQFRARERAAIAFILESINNL